MSDRTLQIPMPDDLREKLKEYAANHDMSMSQVVRKLLRDWLDQQEKRDAETK